MSRFACSLSAFLGVGEVSPCAQSPRAARVLRYPLSGAPAPQRPAVCSARFHSGLVPLHCLLLLALCIFAPLMACQSAEPQQEAPDTVLLAVVDGDALTQKDFELTQDWLPDFVQQMDWGSQLKLNRFSALLQMTLMAREAQKQRLLTAPQRSLAIKQSLAQLYLERESAKLAPSFSPAQISSYISAHPEKFAQSERYIVVYALVHSARRAQILRMAYGQSLGAQWGKLSSSQVALPSDWESLHFDLDFATRFTENSELSPLVGPFAKEEKIALSCEQTMNVLHSCAEGEVIAQNISCDAHWHSFAVLEKKQLSPELSTQERENLARQALMQEAQEQRRLELLEAR